MAKRIDLVKQLTDVIQQCIEDKVRMGKKECPCVMVTLLSVDGVEHREEIHSIPLAGLQGAEEIAEIMHGRAVTYAQGSDTTAKFELVFFYEGSDKPKKPYPFKIISQLAYGEHGAEEATAKSLVKQMRADTNEVLRLAFSQINVMQEHTMTLLDAATRQIQVANQRADMALEDREVAIEMIVQQRAAMQNKSHEQRMAEIKAQENSAFKRMAIEAAPAFINTLANKPLLPEGTGDTALVKLLLSALEKIPDDLKMALFTSLPQEVTLPLMSRGVQLQEKIKAERAAEAKAIEEAGRVGIPPETPMQNGQTQNGQPAKNLQ